MAKKKHRAEKAKKPGKRPIRIPAYAQMWARQGEAPIGLDAARQVFAPMGPPKFVTQAPSMAQDEDLQLQTDWAANVLSSVFAEGLTFMGYPILAELSQRAEYRRGVETLANDMTRKWIKLKTASNDDKTEQIKKIDAEIKRLKLRDTFKTSIEHDGFFGRGHLYIDTGDTEDREELKMPIGDASPINDNVPDKKKSGDKPGIGKKKEEEDETVGASDLAMPREPKKPKPNAQAVLSQSKINPGHPIVGVRAIEAVWTYPTQYNASDPLRGDWYAPQTWFVMGKEVHSTRLLTIIGRPVADLLKPAYSFGGLALTQMAKPYVDNWLRTRQSVADIVQAFSVFILATDLETILSPSDEGASLIERARWFNLTRNNKGLALINKDSEEISNVAAPLGTLDALQAATQEHMAAVFGIPIVKLFGIQPAGLNASSDGEIRMYYDWIHAFQEWLLRDPLTRLIGFIQLSLFGFVDPDITFDFEHLWELDAVQAATKRKTEAETDEVLISNGVIDNAEARQRVANDPDTPYQGLDVNDVPEMPTEGEGEEGEGGFPEDPEGGGEGEKESGEAGPGEKSSPSGGGNAKPKPKVAKTPIKEAA